jgi:uncharacterized membrane protein
MMHWWWQPDPEMTWTFWPMLGAPVLFVLLFLVLVLSTRPAAARRAALDVLEERFVSGEIDRREFEEKKQLISDR